MCCNPLFPLLGNPCRALQDFESMQKLKKDKVETNGEIEKNGETNVLEGEDKDYKPHGLAQREAQGQYSRRSKRIMKEVSVCHTSILTDQYKSNQYKSVKSHHEGCR